MKKFKVVIALAVVSIMAFVMTGCGSVDASGLVKANLDYYKTGEITEETLEIIDMSEEDLKSNYNEEFDDMIDEFADGLGNDDYMDNGGRDTVTTFMKKYLAACKYEVAEEAVENEDGSYTVTVTVYPMDLIEQMEEYVEGDFTEEWTNKITSGEYNYTSQTKLESDMYADLFETLIDMVDEVNYGDGEEMTVTVTESDDTYRPNSDEIGNVLAKCMGME